MLGGGEEDVATRAGPGLGRGTFAGGGAVALAVDGGFAGDFLEQRKAQRDRPHDGQRALRRVGGQPHGGGLVEHRGFRAEEEPRPFPDAEADDAHDEREEDGGDHDVEVVVPHLLPRDDDGQGAGVALFLRAGAGLPGRRQHHRVRARFDEFIFHADGLEAGGAGGLGGFFGGGQAQRFELPGLGEEADGRVRVEDFLHACRAGHGEQPDEREQGHEDERRAAFVAQRGFQNDGRGEAKRDAGEELVGDAKDGPERLDAALRVRHGGDEKVTPERGDGGAGGDAGKEIAGVAERLPDMAERVLQEVAAHARAGVERGQDKERLKHHREVVPHAHPAPAEQPRKERRHAHGERGPAAGAADERVLVDLRGEGFHLRASDGEDRTEGVHFLDHRGGVAFHVDRQIDAGIERAGGDHGHDGDERFEAHRAVAHGPRITFAGDDLRGHAAGDEGVKTADRPARDGDETERKEPPRHDRTRAVDERSERGHLQNRQHEQRAEREGKDGAELHESAQVIARREEQPDRQDARGEAVDDDRPGEKTAVLFEDGAQGFMLVNPLAAPDREEHQGHAHD